MLALAVLAGYGVAWLLGRISRRQISEISESANSKRRIIRYASTRLLVSGLPVYLSTCLARHPHPREHLAVPLPTTDARIPEVYRRIGAEPGEFAIMQLPLGWRNSFGVLGSEQTNLQYFQTGHGKPMHRRQHQPRAGLQDGLLCRASRSSRR